MKELWGGGACGPPPQQGDLVLRRGKGGVWGGSWLTAGPPSSAPLQGKEPFEVSSTVSCSGAATSGRRCFLGRRHGPQACMARPRPSTLKAQSQGTSFMSGGGGVLTRCCLLLPCCRRAPAWRRTCPARTSPAARCRLVLRSSGEAKTRGPAELTRPSCVPPKCHSACLPPAPKPAASVAQQPTFLLPCPLPATTPCCRKHELHLLEEGPRLL